MFGTLRFILALLVAVGHLWGFWFAASHAVFTFYVLSGFLMTLVLQKKYGFERSGFTEFWIARLSRLLPSYWIGCGLSIGLILWLSLQVTTDFNEKLTWPDSLPNAFANLTMLGLLQPNSEISFIPNQFPTLVPPAWALSIELFFYFCLSVYFAKTPQRCLALLATGAIYLVCVAALDLRFYWVYFFFPAGAIPFASGALLYFALQYEAIRSIFSTKLLLIASSTFYIAVYALAGLSEVMMRVGFLYLNIFAAVVFIGCLYTVKGRSGMEKLDSFLGDLSFPVYVFHWQIGLFMAHLFDLERGTAVLFFASLPVLIGTSVVDRSFVSGPVEKWRRTRVSAE